jgi:heme/copper-type cytochrome/quinol oxidase subunit 3
VSELASHATGYSVVERESPEIPARNLRVASHLWSSATAFFFFAFLFAYFYLRTLNQNHMWRPKHVDPSLTLGTLVAVGVVCVALLLRLALADHRRENRRAWRQKGGLAVVLLLAAIVLQIVEWSTQGFGPTDGGYASVYLGWTALQLLFMLGLLYWLETTLATSLRYRKVFPAEFAPGEASGDRHREATDIDNPLVLVRAELEGLSFFAAVFAGVVTLGWIVLYLL